MATRSTPPPPSLGRVAALRVSLLLSACLFLWGLGLLGVLGARGVSLIVFLVYVCTGGHYTLYLIWHTLPRDIRWVDKLTGTMRVFISLFLFQRCLPLPAAVGPDVLLPEEEPDRPSPLQPDRVSLRAAEVPGAYGQELDVSRLGGVQQQGGQLLPGRRVQAWGLHSLANAQQTRETDKGERKV